MKVYVLFIKPIADILVASLVFVVLLPIFFVLTIGLLIANNGKPFFIQIRPGKSERLFKILKFKTMNDKKDAHGELLPDVDRLTPIGKFVRKTSLDEIPQLLNVINGDMSLVGPRPLLPEYLPLYNSSQKKRHEVKPGITGWAQVNGRNAISWDEKLALDSWYVQNISMGLDIKILVKTVFKVLASKDINPKEKPTIEKFTGSPES